MRLVGTHIRLHADDYSEENSVLRSRVKRLTLQAINAKTRESAFSAFRSQCKAGDPEKRLTNIELNDLLEAFLTEHPALRPYVSKGIANELMYLMADNKLCHQSTYPAGHTRTDNP